ncbi:MAG: VCBS repeat-containing protein [Planctomycetota bacterium]
MNIAILFVSMACITYTLQLEAQFTEPDFDAATMIAQADAGTVLIEDVDGDGHVDLIAGSLAGGTVSIRFGDGVLGFGTPAVYTTAGDAIDQVDLADLDFDGIDDLVTVERGSTMLSAVRGVGDGTFSDVFQIDMDAPIALFLAVDFDLNGLDDLLIVQSNFSSSARARFGIRADESTFISSPAYSAIHSILFSGGGLDYTEIAAPDFTGEGRPDVVVAGRRADGSSGLLTLRNTGIPFESLSFIGTDPDFEFPIQLLTLGNAGNLIRGDPATTAALAIDDFNRDGTLEALLCTGVPVGYAILPVDDNDVVFALDATPDDQRIEIPVDVISSDFDLDGRLDALFVDKSEGLIFLAGDGGENVGALTNIAQFAYPQTYSVPGICGAEKADLDSDGDEDLVVWFESGSVSVLRNDTEAVTRSTSPIDSAAPFGTLDFLDIIEFLRGVDEGCVDAASRDLNRGQSFSMPIPFTAIGSNARTFELADVTGDGILDLVIDRVFSVETYPGDGAGGFGGLITSPDLISPTGVEFGRDFELADVDGDGHIDWIGSATQLEVSIALGDGTGRFGTPASLSGPADLVVPTDIEITDLNGDGSLDIVVVYNSSGGRLLIHFGDGQGGFDTRVVPLPFGFADEILFGDIDGDTRTDILVNRNGSDRYALLRSTDAPIEPATAFESYSPVLTDPLFLASGFSGRDRAALADVNDDGFDDLIAPRRDEGGFPVDEFSRMRVIINAGGVFAPDPALVIDRRVLSFNGDLPFFTFAQDLNADGRVDFGAFFAFPPFVFAFTGDEQAPQYQDIVAVPDFLRVIDADVADLNNDGQPDFVVLDEGSEGISIILNQTPNRCRPEDLAPPFGVLDSNDISEALSLIESGS